MTLNQGCWMNWVLGIVFLVIAFIKQDMFIGVFGGISIGYAIGGLIVYFHTKKVKGK